MSTATITAPAAPWTDEDRLRADLAEWITDRGPVNRAGYSPEKTAGLIVASLWGPALRQMIDADDSRYLWNCAVNIRNANDQDDDEWAAEDNRHGHGPVDGLVRA